MRWTRAAKGQAIATPHTLRLMLSECRQDVHSKRHQTCLRCSYCNCVCDACSYVRDQPFHVGMGHSGCYKAQTDAPIVYYLTRSVRRTSTSLVVTDVETHVLHYSGALGAVRQVFGKLTETKRVLLCNRVVESIINFCVQCLDGRWNANHSLSSTCELRPCNAICMQHS